MIKQTKKENAITLIALVITIIVLLILAGIGIAILIGENGILNKANIAKEENQKAEAEEQIKLAVMASYDENGKLEINKLKEELGKIPNVGEIRDTNEGFSIEVDLDGYTFQIDENGNVTRIAGKPVVNYTLSTTEQVAEGTEVLVTITATTTEGTIAKISKQGETIETNKNTATFVVTTNGMYEIVVEGSNGEKATCNILITNIGNSEIFSDIYTGTETYTDKNGNTARIPEGFAVGISDTINTIENGLVITDEIDENHKSTGNEFVWIPVDSASNFKRVAGYSDLSNQATVLPNCSEPYTSGSQDEKDAYITMYNSVLNDINSGFYMGRYEAGKENNQVVVKKNKPVYNDVKWGTSMTNLTGGAVELAKNFISDKTYKTKVTTSLCYGVQWDTTLQFFNDSAYLKNSIGKGNQSTTLIDTGSNENYKVKNIYDMAGNVWEWTMEAINTTGRILRGGGRQCSTTAYGVSVRISKLPTVSGNLPTNLTGTFGFRITMFVNI